MPHVSASSGGMTSGTTAEVQQEGSKAKKPSSFLELPDPIREQIIQYLLDQPGNKARPLKAPGVRKHIPLPPIALVGNRALYLEAVRVTLMKSTFEIYDARAGNIEVCEWLAGLDLSLVSSNQKTGFDAIRKLSFPCFGNFQYDFPFAKCCTQLRVLNLTFAMHDIIEWDAGTSFGLPQIEKSADQLRDEYDLDEVLALKNLGVIQSQGYCGNYSDSGIRSLAMWFETAFEKQVEAGERTKKVQVLFPTQ